MKNLTTPNWAPNWAWCAAIVLAALVTVAGTANAQISTPDMEAPTGVWTPTNYDVRTYWWGLVPTGGDVSILYNGFKLATDHHRCVGEKSQQVETRKIATRPHDACQLIVALGAPHQRAEAKF